ncbi:MAG: hypothetical protein K0R72_37 [Clostridia bacterium]|jgi:hypothetical protein|nr:hypothetical protein [Clostridia bacterium]
MNSTVVSGRLDSLFVRSDDKRVFFVVEYDDDMMGMPQHISADITEELQQIHHVTEFDKVFVKKIEEDMKVTLGKEVIYLRYSNEKEWVLDRPLQQWYLPNISK